MPGISSLETQGACPTWKKEANTYVQRITGMILSIDHKNVLPICVGFLGLLKQSILPKGAFIERFHLLIH